MASYIVDRHYLSYGYSKTVFLFYPIYYIDIVKSSIIVMVKPFIRNFTYFFYCIHIVDTY